MAGLDDDGELSSMEAALEAWAACQPEGYALPAASVPLVLPVIACHVPGSWKVPETAQMLAELFQASGDGPPVFQRLLKVRGDRVHFLDFWRAFSKATHLLSSLRRDGIAKEEALAMELETVRDGVLRLLEAQGGAHDDQAVTLAELALALRNAAAMSQAPEFWRDTEVGLEGRGGDERLSLEDLSELMLDWLQEGIAWQHRKDGAPAATPDSGRAASSSASADAEARGRRPGKPGLPVFLHIYDVSQEDGVRKLNKVLAHRYSPVKFGGVFHAGVEVNGLEWSFGMSQSETLPGLSCVLPREHPNHRYRQTVELHRTMLSPEEIADLISHLAEEYPGHDYHLLRRNCCHFADDFCRRIGAGKIPGWVHRLARVGAHVDSLMHRVMNRRLLPEDSDED